MQSQGGLSIQRMCELATVSRASFYRHWEQKAPTEAEMALRDAIQRMAVGHRFYGYRRITVLVQNEGYAVGTTKVRRWMKEDNLLAVRRRKFVTTTDSDHDFVVYPNLAEQLILQDVNQLWVADITYIRLLREFVYLAVVLDAFSRRVVGWALSRSLANISAVGGSGKRDPQSPAPSGISPSFRSRIPVCQQGVCGAAGEPGSHPEHESSWAAVGEGLCFILHLLRTTDHVCREATPLSKLDALCLPRWIWSRIFV
jgi:AcrR family transcriptional regulator